MSHTPTPWVINRMTTGDGHHIWSIDKEVDRGALREICRSYDLDGESLDNADFIVQACNKHDELKALFDKDHDTSVKLLDDYAEYEHQLRIKVAEAGVAIKEVKRALSHINYWTDWAYCDGQVDKALTLIMNILDNKRVVDGQA